jgi:plasmid stabilization system protein ParE
MKKYTVVLSDEAMADIDALFNYIANEVKLENPLQTDPRLPI